MGACVVLAQLISSDVSLLMVGLREDGSFIEMSCGRCWTMTGTKERFEHCTSKTPSLFLFHVSPSSSTTESFFLSLAPLLIAARRIPCSFLSSPLCSPCLPPQLPLSPYVFFLFFMSSSWNLFPPSLSPLFFLCSVSHLLYPTLLGSAFFCDETVAHGFWGGRESSRTQWLNIR